MDNNSVKLEDTTVSSMADLPAYEPPTMDSPMTAIKHGDASAVDAEAIKLRAQLLDIRDAIQNLGASVTTIARQRQHDHVATCEPHIAIAGNGTIRKTRGLDYVALSLTGMIQRFQGEFEQLQQHAELNLKLPTGSLTEQGPSFVLPLATRASKRRRNHKRDRRSPVEGPKISIRASRLTTDPRPSVSALQQARRYL